MIIIGHRGAKGLSEENTVGSIKRALDENVDMIEVDVRLHSDNLVLSHEPTLHIGDYCTLADALDSVNGRVPLILEVKEERVVNKLKKALENYNGEYTISSKLFGVLDKLRKTMPDAQLAVTEKWSGVRAVAEASLLGTSELHFNHNWLWSGFVRSLKQKGYTVFAYTVNSTDRADELESWGVDGIFTDYPNKFKER